MTLPYIQGVIAERYNTVAVRLSSEETTTTQKVARLAVATVTIVAMSYFSSLTAMAVGLPTVGSWVGSFVALPALTKIAALSLVSGAGVAIGLGAGLTATAAIVLVKAKLIFDAMGYINIIAQLAVGLALLYQGHRINIGVADGGKETVTALYGNRRLASDTV